MLELDCIEWVDGDPTLLGRFYGELSKAPQLEEIEQQSCLFVWNPDLLIEIPKHLITPWSEDEEDEYGYIWIHRPDADIHYRGKDKVKEVLEEYASDLQYR
jgi:hypothetical protein